MKIQKYLFDIRVISLFYIHKINRWFFERLLLHFNDIVTTLDRYKNMNRINEMCYLHVRTAAYQAKH